MKSTLLLKPPFMMLQSSSILIVHHETSQTTIFRGVNSWHLRLLLHPLELSTALLADLMPSLQFSGLGKAGSIVMGDPQLGFPHKMDDKMGYPHGLETPIKKRATIMGTRWKPARLLFLTPSSTVIFPLDLGWAKLCSSIYAYFLCIQPFVSGVRAQAQFSC